MHIEIQPIAALNLFLDARFERQSGKLQLKSLVYDQERSNIEWSGGLPYNGGTNANNKVILRFVWVLIANKLNRSIPEPVLSSLRGNLKVLAGGERVPLVRELFGELPKRKRSNTMRVKKYCRVVHVFQNGFAAPGKTNGLLDEEILGKDKINVMLRTSQSAEFLPANETQLRAILEGFDATSFTIIEYAGCESTEDQVSPEVSSDSLVHHQQNDGTRGLTIEWAERAPINLMTIPIFVLAVGVLVFQTTWIKVLFFGLLLLWAGFVGIGCFLIQASKFANKKQLNWLTGQILKLDSTNFFATREGHVRDFPIRLAVGKSWLVSGVLWVGAIFLVAYSMKLAVPPSEHAPFWAFLAASAVLTIAIWIPALLAWGISLAVFRLRHVISWVPWSTRIIRAIFCVSHLSLVFFFGYFLILLTDHVLLKQHNPVVAVLIFFSSPLIGVVKGSFAESLASAICFGWALLPFAIVCWQFLRPLRVVDEGGNTECGHEGQSENENRTGLREFFSEEEKRKEVREFAEYYFNENRLVVGAVLPLLIWCFGKFSSLVRWLSTPTD